MQDELETAGRHMCNIVAYGPFSSAAGRYGGIGMPPRNIVRGKPSVTIAKFTPFHLEGFQFKCFYDVNSLNEPFDNEPKLQCFILNFSGFVLYIF